MLTPQYTLPLHHELVVDLFAGGGGASTGIEQAIGRPVDVAVNHDPEAVSLHTANHPQTRHFCADVFEVDPLTATGGQPVGLLWASPDCKHFSKAKGGKPVSKKIRGLAWMVVKWAKAVRPRVICLENVEEFQTWGPLGTDNKPCPQRKGKTFALWKGQLERLGYTIEHRELRACDFGAPTIRKRLFLVARRDGQPIVWPTTTHAKPDANGKVPNGMQPWRTAAECIDWSIPCPSIFERSKPLADATCRRIAKGIMRYVVESAQPFIVTWSKNDLQHQPRPHPDTRGEMQADRPKAGHGSPTDDGVDGGVGALHTSNQRRGSIELASMETTGATDEAVENSGPQASVSASNTKSEKSEANNARTPAASTGILTHTLAPFLTEHANASTQRTFAADEPLRTQVAQVKGGHFALVSAFLAKHYTGVVGSDLADPMGTVTSVDHHSLVTSHMVKLRGDNVGSPVDEPLHTVSAQGLHHGEVRAFLVKYYSEGGQDQPCTDPMHTIPTKDRLGLVMVHGEPWAIVDIGLRMLTPRELYRAQGFPDNYQIEHGAAGEAITKTAQVRMCGNSVCPPLSRAIVAANYAEQQQLREAA